MKGVLKVSSETQNESLEIAVFKLGKNPLNILEEFDTSLCGPGLCPYSLG